MYFGRLGLHINGVWPAQTAKISSKLRNDSHFRRCGSITCKHKRTTVPCNLGLWISSNLIIHQVTMEQSNDDATAFLKTLLERFNSLERDVTKFKEKQARRNLSAAGSSGMGAPMTRRPVSPRSGARLRAKAAPWARATVFGSPTHPRCQRSCIVHGHCGKAGGAAARCIRLKASSL